MRKLSMEQLEPRCVLSGTLHITEFLASNHSGLVDNDGDTSDWLELHNPTAGTVNLDGWSLTDDPDELNLWQFPDVTISPDGYLVVFASGKDLTNPASELHTNFKLSADGDYLAVVQVDGVTIEHEYTNPYPRQLGDVSYGIDPGNPTVGTYYYTSSSPMTPNTPSAFQAA